jgi:uncharacterized membrane protein
MLIPFFVVIVTGSFVGIAFSSGFSPPIDYPGASTTRPGISDDDRIVGYFFGPPHGFLYQESQFTEIHFSGAASSGADDVNSDGHIVGTYSISGGGTHGYLFTDDTFHALDHPTGENTNLFGINNDDEIVGIYTELAPYRSRGFRYDGTTFHPIDFPGAAHTFASGISNNGLVVGSYGASSPEEHGFLFDGTSYYPIDFPGAERTLAAGVNSQGWVVGTYILSNGGARGFVFKDGEYKSINYPANNNTTNLYDINDAGVAVGTFETGPYHVFTFVVPEPSAVALFVFVLPFVRISLLN